MNDLISREELKKAIETYDKFACLPNGKIEPFRNLEHPEEFEPYVHLRDIRNVIDNAPTVEQPTGEWIPVSVQEPAVGGIYFVTAKHVSGHIGIDIARRISDNVWTFGGEELKGTEIIAWMPLPKPYEKGGETNDL